MKEFMTYDQANVANGRAAEKCLTCGFDAADGAGFCSEGCRLAWERETARIAELNQVR